MIVDAWVTDGGTLSYQWYVKNGDGQWNAIEGAAGSSYLPSTEIPGTYEYQCRVTNTIESGNQRTTTVGWTVKVLDKEPDQPAEPEKPENNGGSSGSRQKEPGRRRLAAGIFTEPMEAMQMSGLPHLIPMPISWPGSLPLTGSGLTKTDT